MKTTLTFFNLGNADTTLIKTWLGKTILWDYANMKTKDAADKRCDLPAELDKRVAGDFDVVTFTHADEDHIKGWSDYFFLEHAKKYQEGKRKKIIELWVPAAVILDSENKNGDDSILKAEARFRLKNKKGIKIFSQPDQLKDWLEKNDIKFDDIKHLIVDAGTKVSGWSKEAQGVEFFVHSPYKGHVDENEVIDRNLSGIIVQMTFGNKVETKLMMGADGHADTWSGIVKITRFHKNELKLYWDIFHISHHCSYTALNCDADMKGKNKTTPVGEVKNLFESYGNSKSLIISPSDAIEFKDTIQPPHFQAYNYYKEDVADVKSGQVIVTMEHPSKEKPSPLEITIDDNGYSISKIGLTEEEKKHAAAKVASGSVVTGNWAQK